MKVVYNDPPRSFFVGRNAAIEMKDCGRVLLEADEQVTFIIASGAEYDVARKEWGFYATPSVNGRLKEQGFKTALVKNLQNRYYILLVEQDKTEQFFSYLQQEESELVEWLDER